MVRRFNSSDAFLNHSTGKQRLNHFNKWKKNSPPTTNVWLHTRVYPIPLWRHQFPNVVQFEKDGDKVKRIFSSPYNCYEDEALLRDQWRLDDNNEREHPPKKCPACRFVEHVRSQINSGAINWIDPVLSYKTPDDHFEVHAAGLCNMVNDRLSDTKKGELKAAGIKMTEAWRETAMPRLNYLFLVVDNNDPAAGVQVAIETALLGDKVKEVVKEMLISLDDGNPDNSSRGDPFKNPYCIQWEHRKSALAFSDKYKARAMPLIKLTPEVSALIRGEPPNIDSLIESFDPMALRMNLESHCLLKDVPWDELFTVPIENRKAVLSHSTHVAELPESTDSLCELCHKADCDHVACDGCGKPMEPSTNKCQSCGMIYGKFDAAVAVKEMPF